MAEVGNDKANASSAFEQDVELLQQEQNDKWMFKSSWDELSWAVSWIGNLISNKYDTFTNDDIKDWASYSELQNIVGEREDLQYWIANDQTLSQSQKDFEYSRINEQFKNKENTLLEQAIDWDDKRLKFDKARKSLYDGAQVETKENVATRVSRDADKIINDMDKVSQNNWLVSNDTLSYKLSIKGSLASDLTNWEVNKRKAIADLRSLNANEWDINKTINSYDEMISLQKSISQQALNAANEGILDGDKLTDYIIENIGKTAMNRAVELKNTMALDLQSRQAKANLKEGNVGMATVEYAGLWGAVIASFLKKGLSVLKTDESKFKGDYSSLQLSDEGWLSYILNYSMDNFDDIAANLVGWAASWGLLAKGIDKTGMVISKASRLENLLQNSSTWRKILDSKITQWAWYFKTQLTTGLGANQTINLAMNDVNSEERLITDALMDLTLWPIFDGVLSSAGYIQWGITKGVLNSKLLEDFTLTDKKLLEELRLKGMDLTEANNILSSTKDYLARTSSNPTNKDIFNFIRENEARLATEGTRVWDGMIMTMRKYQNKSYNPLNVNVDAAKSIVSNNWFIKLTDNTLDSLDLKEIFKKVNRISIEKTPEKTVESLLALMGGLKKSTIKSFISQNKEIVASLNEAIVIAKAKTKAVSELNYIDESTSPLNEIGELSDAINALTEKLGESTTVVKVYLPVVKDWVTTFTEKIVAKDSLSIEGYSVIHNSEWKTERVLVTKSLANKIQWGEVETSASAKAILNKGFIHENGVDNVDDLLASLTEIFWMNVKLNWDGEVRLIKNWPSYYIDFKSTLQIVKDNANQKITYNKSDLKVTLSNINKILLDVALNKTDVYTPGEIQDVLTSATIKLSRDIKEGAVINEDYTGATIKDATMIATKNVEELLSTVFDKQELIDFNKLSKETILTESSLNKLSTLSQLGSKENGNAMWALIEWLMLRAAERFSQPSIKRLIIKVLNDTDKELSTINKNDAITNILLGETPINAFKYVWPKSAWHVTKLDTKKLGMSPTDDIFNISKEGTAKFIASVVERKKQIGTDTPEQIKKIQEDLNVLFTERVNVATSLYTDNIIRSALNPKSVDNVMQSKQIGKVTNEEDFASSILSVMNEWLDQAVVVQKVNDIVTMIPDVISKNQFNKVSELIFQIRKDSNIDKWGASNNISILVKGVNKFSDIIDKHLKIDMDSIGSQYPYESQTSGWDNLLTKSLNYILNPYQGSKVYNKNVGTVIDKFITDNILMSKEFSQDIYKGKGFLSEANKAKEPDGHAATYQKDTEAGIEKIRSFLYPQSNSFKLDKRTKWLLTKRDKILDDLITIVTNTISNDKNITILNKDWTVAVGIQKGNIIREWVTRKNIVNTLQTRIKRKNFEWYKIDFKKGWTPEKIEGIEEYRTMYKHFHDAWKVKGNIKPLILEGNKDNNPLRVGSRENYRIANNLYKFSEWISGTFEQKKKQVQWELTNYLNQTGDTESFNSIISRVNAIHKDKNHVDGFINIMNVWDKDSFWAYTETYIKSTISGKLEGKEWITDFTTFMDINDEAFTDDMVKELNMWKVTKDDWAGWKVVDMTKVAKRIATITAEEESLLPGSAIVVRNYIIDEPEYIDAILQDSDVTKESLFEPTTSKRGDRSYEVLNTNGMQYILDNFPKELAWFKPGFTLKDFEFYNKAIVDLLTTPYSDGVSFLHPDQIKFYSNYQTHIDSKGEFPIKMHHYWQDENWSVLYKTNFNGYTKQILKDVQAIDPSLDITNTRLIWAESEKLKTYAQPMTAIEWDKYITINWVRHRVKGYIETTTAFDRHASTEAETHSEANGITKQADTRTHGAASEFILRTKKQLIAETIVELRKDFGIDKKLDALIFNEFEDLANFVLNETGLPGSSFSTVNAFLKGKLKTLSSKIEWPKDEGLWFRSVMQPRINRLINWVTKRIADDEIAVSPARFASMMGKMLEVDTGKKDDKGKTIIEYYVNTYRNPVPNTENMTINKVVIDESMVSIEDSALGSWNVFINKQADFDGDHLNITYINNPKYLADNEGKLPQLWGLWIAIWTIFNIEDTRKINWTALDERVLKNEDLMAKIYASEDAASMQEEITQFVVDYIKEQWDNWVEQTRVPVAQVEKDQPVDNIKPGDWTLAWDFVGSDGEDVIQLPVNTKKFITSLLKEDGYNQAEAELELNIMLSDNDLKDYLQSEIKILENSLDPDDAKKIISVNKVIKNISNFKKKAAKLNPKAEPLKRWTLVKASSNAITGKDNISIVDGFIRTLDLVRKYGWEYNNAEKIWKTKAEVIMDYKEWLSFTINNLKEELTRINEVPSPSKWQKKRAEELTAKIPAMIDSAEQMLSRIWETMSNPEYKSLSAALEQMTLDLAHAGLDKLPEGWAETLYDTVYPWIDYGMLDELLWPVTMNTSKVYKEIGQNGVLNYWKSYDKELREQTYMDLPLFGQHRQLYHSLFNEIGFIQDKLSSISRLDADKKFFGFNNDESYLTIANETLSKFKVKPGLLDLIRKPKEPTTWYVTWRGNVYIPGLSRVWNKEKKTYELVIEDKGLLSAHVTKNPIEGISPDGTITKAAKVDAHINKYPFPGLINAKDAKTAKWTTSIIKGKEKEFMDAVSYIDLEDHKPLANGMTPTMYAEILSSKVGQEKWYTTSPVAIKAKGFTSKELAKGRWFRVTINDKDKEIDIINEMMDSLSIEGRERNAILLKNSFSIDPDNLSRTERLKLIYTHYILKDPSLKDMARDDDGIIELAKGNIVNVINRADGVNLDDEGKKKLKALQEELSIEEGYIKDLWGEYVVSTDNELGNVITIGDTTYNIDQLWDGQYSIYAQEETPYYKVDDEEVQSTLDSLQTTTTKREFNLIKELGITTNDLNNVADRLDRTIDDIGKYTNRLMSTKTMKVFKDLMLRNQALKNNATYDLYEDFTHVQKQFSWLDKIKRRQIDNHVFMDLYKGKGALSKAELDEYRKHYSVDERQYYENILGFIKGDNAKGQSIAKMFGEMNLDLSKLVRSDWNVIDINKRITSSLVEDVVNLRHKTEKISFYEEGIYDYGTFKAAYEARSKELNIPVDVTDMKNIYDVVFEFDLIKNNSIKKTVNLMRWTTFSTTLGAFSWVTWMAWFTMGLMQIPSELLRLGSFSKHKYAIEELDTLMDTHKILKSTGIEAGIHFWPIEAKPEVGHAFAYNLLTGFSPKSGLHNTIAKNVSAVIANPLIVTDLVVDASRKRTAVGNLIQMLGFTTTEQLTAHLAVLPKAQKEELLNKIRLGSELKYHELSWGVTAGSYLFRETSFARQKGMLPFSYLMNWALHTQSTTLASAKQAFDWMGKIWKGDKEEGLRLIKESNFHTRTFGQSLVIAGLYAKLNSHDEYDGEFKTRKDVFEFVKTLNSNILSLEMFWPIKAMETWFGQEWGLTAKIASGLGSVAGSTFRELDLIGIVSEELWTASQTPGYNTWEAITAALVNKGSKGLGFSKMIEMESQFPEFAKRSQIDQMFWSDNPNFDEELYSKMYSEAKGIRLDALWESGNPAIILGEITKSIPIIRHLSNMTDGGTSYSFYDKQVREVNKRLTDGSYDAFYDNPELLIDEVYQGGDIGRVRSYANKFASKFGKLDFKDKDLVQTSISKFIPEIKYWGYAQLTESIIVGEAINELWVEGYIRQIGTGSENNQYVKQLLGKIEHESPAKLPYVLGLLLATDYSAITYGLKKNGQDVWTAHEELIKAQLLMKYKDLIGGSKPMMAQMLGYQVLNDNPELQDIMLSNNYLSDHIADRITTRLMITESYEKGENHAGYIGSRFGALANKISGQFAKGDIDEGVFKTSLLDLYRIASEEIQDGNFTSDQKLEIKTTLYKSLGDHAYILYEDESLWDSYESSRINLAHKLYDHTSVLSKYANDAAILWADWDITDEGTGKGSTWSGKRYGSAYRNTNLIRNYSGGGGWKGGNYNSWFVQRAANNIQGMLGNPKTNFAKIFKPTYSAYSGTNNTPYGFKFTPEDTKIFLEYFRSVASPQYSKDLFEKKGYSTKASVFRTSRRKAELTKQYYKNIWRQQFRWDLSRWLLKGLPGWDD